MAALLGLESYVLDILGTRCNDAHWNRCVFELLIWNYAPEEDEIETQVLLLRFQVQFLICFLCEGLPV